MLLALVAIGFNRSALRAGLHTGDLRADRGIYIVFTANAFALMGLRQLYFPDRRAAGPVDLSVGRTGDHPGFHRGEADAARCTKNTLPFISNGDYVGSRISTVMSIGVIAVVLFVTTVATCCAPVTGRTALTEVQPNRPELSGACEPPKWRDASGTNQTISSWSSAIRLRISQLSHSGKSMLTSSPWGHEDLYRGAAGFVMGQRRDHRR